MNVKPVFGRGELNDEPYSRIIPELGSDSTVILFAISVQLEGTVTSSTSARATAFLRMMEIPALAVMKNNRIDQRSFRLTTKLAYCTLRCCEVDISLD